MTFFSMALTIQQQIAENIKKSEKILIVFPKFSSGDHIGSAIGLALALQKLHKNVTVASDGFVVTSKYKFLPQIDQILGTLSNPKKLVIQLDVSKTKVSDFRYDMKDDTLNIYVTPEEGTFQRYLCLVQRTLTRLGKSTNQTGISFLTPLLSILITVRTMKISAR